MKKNAIICSRLPPARHLVLWLSVLLAMAFMLDNSSYASTLKDATDFPPSKMNNTYGKRYSHAILRGVKLSDIFTFNDTETTFFGPAYANIWTSPPNFLQCMPPTGRKFSYALCYYSGPDDPTGNNPDNPSLPCKLSPDGVVANCQCYEISTDMVSPKIPYFVDIHAISNLNIYQETVETCGQEGEKCAATDRDPPVCEAINTNLLVPGADLISVFSPVYIRDYSNQGEDNSTECLDENAGLYAGCMTAPCYRTGEKDAQGRDIVECKCPVFDGPYQIGQADQDCNANDPPPNTMTWHRKPKKMRGSNVWSAAYNPAGGPISLPADACVPDLPGDNGCGLYDPNKDYGKIINPDGALCTNVCAAYGESVTNGIQVGYSCDATLCTTLGIGQENNPKFPPPPNVRTQLLSEACNTIQDINGMKQIMLVEALAECSCCASQVCGCDNINDNINQATNSEIYYLNQQQRQPVPDDPDVGIVPQCDINFTLCGEDGGQAD